VCPSSLGVSVLNLTTSVTVTAPSGQPCDKSEALAEGGRVLERASALLLAPVAAVEVWHLSFALPVGTTVGTAVGADSAVGQAGAVPSSEAGPWAADCLGLDCLGLECLGRLPYQPDPWPQLSQARDAFGRLFGKEAPFLVQSKEAARECALARGETVDADDDEDALHRALAGSDASEALAAEAQATRRIEVQAQELAQELARRVGVLEAGAREEGRRLGAAADRVGRLD
jgi:hypothetical protein